jgi:hypothetical protein
MDRPLLARALGAIASYAMSRYVPAVRVVFCDAASYDARYLRPEEIAGSVRVRGRGGTALQPGIDLLQRADDFPAKGPLLVITDRVQIRREHAFLLPRGRALPFAPKGLADRTGSRTRRCATCCAGSRLRSYARCSAASCAAWRRKALVSQRLPIQVVALDGKVTALPCLDERFVQNRHRDDRPPLALVPHGHGCTCLRTGTAVH